MALADGAETEDEEDEEEREEERQKAREAFAEVSEGSASVPSAKFQALMEALGTTYCEEEHRRTLRRLAPGGTVAKDAFVEWYQSRVESVPSSRPMVLRVRPVSS